MFRAVALPERLAGRLFLHSMPERYEAYEDAWQEIARCHVSRVVCLAPLAEVQTKSSRYAQAIEADLLPWVQEIFPVADYGIPDDRDGFWRLAQRLAAGLQRGERILIHCGAGIDRTGTLAICVLLALGMAIDHACVAVKAAGSSPETPTQREVISWAAAQCGLGGAQIHEEHEPRN
jgi:protein-tyrosine phosphatase